MQLFPDPNQTIITGTQPTGDYFYNTPGRQTDQGDARVDYRLSDKDSLFGSMSWGNTSKTSVPPFPGARYSGFSGTGEIDLNRNGQVSYTRVWTPTMVIGNPRQLHPSGDLARRAPIRIRTCLRSSASAGTTPPTPTRQRRSAVSDRQRI